MKAVLRKVHRYVSLAFVGLWLLQAATGVLLVFHWEFDDAALNGPARPLNPAAFDAGLRAAVAERPGTKLTAIYASGGSPNRFDAMLEKPDGKSDVLRVDGGGAVLRQRPSDYDFAHIGPFQIATYLHQTLFAGDRGQYLIGISGAVLLSNIVIGLQMAWPRRGQWRRALIPTGGKGPVAPLYGWHRALGLWFAAPALLLVSAGVVLVFEAPFDGLAAPWAPAPERAASTGSGGEVSLAQALTTAGALYPQARLAAVETPSPQSPWYKVRFRQAGDARRVFGTTTVYVDAHGGRVLADYDARRAPWGRKALTALNPLHTGEIGGFAGRVIAVGVGLWLLTLASLGVVLWWTRRRLQARAGNARTA